MPSLGTLRKSHLFILCGAQLSTHMIVPLHEVLDSGRKYFLFSRQELAKSELAA